MTTPITNAGDAPSFFAQIQASDLPGGVLINTQIDPTLPEATGLTRVSDPLLADQHFSRLVKNFDPEIYDLRSTSHLSRLLKALLGASGTGGLKKQAITSRLNGSLAITAFADLDSFYGAIFNFNRYSIESMPTLPSGNQIDPYTDVATPEVWDDTLSRDARYRSRVFQVARAINMGASVSGIKGVAEALLNVEVDVAESWVKADEQYSFAGVTAPSGLSFANIAFQYPTYKDFTNQTYNFAEGGQYGAGVAPTGNRSEVVLTPRRLISDEEKLQLTKVLRTIRPSHTQITIGSQLNQATSTVPARQYFSDSEDWDVVARITANTDLNQPTDPLYANSGEYSVARPVFSEYSGEAWTYNTNIIKTYTYQIIDGQQIQNATVETITYQDQTTHQYAPGDAVMDVRQALSERLSGNGVLTAFPYVGNR